MFDVLPRIFTMIYNFYQSVFHELDSVLIVSGVSLLDLMLSALILGFVINIFWKGAKA